MATMQVTAEKPAPARETVEFMLPPLETGDWLTRSEFEHRYEARPDLKAELIEGEVVVSAAVHVSHGRPHAQIIGWLSGYLAATPGVDLLDNSTLRLDEDNDVQPDAMMRLEPAAGGRSRVTEDDYVEGSPELVVEIAVSSVSIDLNRKLRVYRRNGVREYAVWQTYDRRLDWFALAGGEYRPLTPDASGVIHSQVFPGLRLAVTALLNGDLAAVLAELQNGLATPEHAAFVARLAASK